MSFKSPKVNMLWAKPSWEVTMPWINGSQIWSSAVKWIDIFLDSVEKVTNNWNSNLLSYFKRKSHCERKSNVFVLLFEAASINCRKHWWASQSSTPALSALISFLSLALIWIQTEGWKSAVLESVTCGHLLSEVVNSGYIFYMISSDMN